MSFAVRRKRICCFVTGLLITLFLIAMRMRLSSGYDFRLTLETQMSLAGFHLTAETRVSRGPATYHPRLTFLIDDRIFETHVVPTAFFWHAFRFERY